MLYYMLYIIYYYEYIIPSKMNLSAVKYFPSMSYLKCLKWF